MIHHVLKPCLAALVTVLAAGPAFADKLEDAEKKITEALTKHKSVLHKTKTTQNIEDEAMTIKTEILGTTEYKRKGDKLHLSRIESKTKGTQTFKGAPKEEVDNEVLMIDDGKFLYTLNRSGKDKTAFKMKRGPDMFDGVSYFKLLRQHSTLKLLPDEKVDGKSVYVLEIQPKTKDANATRTVQYIDMKSGITIKSVSFNKAGKAIMTTVTTDLKIDTDVSDDRFVFKAPDSVQVMDMTKMNQQAETTPVHQDQSTTETEEKESEPAKPEQPKEEEQKEKKKGGLGGLLDKLR